MARKTKAQRMEEIRGQIQIMAILVGGSNLSTTRRQDIASGLREIYRELQDWT